MPLDEHRATNLAAWDERVPVHAASRTYDVAGFLAPGGLLHLREGHPMLGTLDDQREDRELIVRHPYFPVAAPLAWDEPGTYTDGGGDLQHTLMYEWPHSLGEVLGVLLEAGFTLTAFAEHDALEWQFFDWMVPDADGRWVLPEGRERLPLMYSLSATAPA